MLGSIPIVAPTSPFPIPVASSSALTSVVPKPSDMCWIYSHWLVDLGIIIIDNNICSNLPLNSPDII